MTDFIDDAPDAGGVSLGDATGFISSALNAGESVTSALDAFRAAGGAIRTSTWYDVAGMVRASMGKAPEISALDPGSIPDSNLFSTWRDAPEGINVYQVDIHVSDPLVGNFTRPYSVMTKDMLTVDEAVSRAVDVYSTNASRYNQRVYGGMLTGLYRAG